MPVNRTLTELDSAIQTEMQLDPGLISSTERKQFINDCIIDIGDIGGFEKTDDLEFTDGIAALPDDFAEFLGLFRGTAALMPIDPALQTAGYFIRYPYVTIRPSNTETLSLWYGYTPSALSDGGDIPDIPAGFDYIIVDYAVARAHRKNGNIGLYREYMSAYETGKYKLQQRLLKLANSRVTTIVNTEDPLAVTPDEDILF